MTARAVVLALLLPLAPMYAQAPDVSRAPTARSPWPTLLLGSGLATTNGGASNGAMATNTGGMLMAAVELPLRQTAGPARVALRAESRWSQQSVTSHAGSGVSGDVQTISAGLLLQLSPLAVSSASSRFTPYVLAGVGATRPSTRVSVLIADPDMLNARFGQTSSEVAATALGGLGAQFRVGFAHLFAEARTEFARLDAGTLRSSFGTFGIVFHRSR